MSDPEDPFGLTGTTLERRFAIERVVAHGGFGVVYKGRHITLKKPVAVKVLAMPANLGLREKQIFLAGFEQEAQTIAALEHPAIVRAYDFGIARPPGRRELPWLALEWIEGASLADWFEARARQPMPPAEALALLRSVFQALAFAHAQHVAHRDIKPANIMIDGDPRHAQAGLVAARLLDFGIAKMMSPEEVVGSGATRTLAAFTAFSTPYAAPEQKLATRSGPWTDVHALGLILTELITGQKPYAGSNALEMELAIVDPSRPTPARAGIDVGAWEPVLSRAVALHGADRFQDAGEFLAALETVAAHAHAPAPAATVMAPVVAAPATVMAPVVHAAASATGPVASTVHMAQAPPSAQGPNAWGLPAAPPQGPAGGWSAPPAPPAGWAPQGSAPASWVPGQGVPTAPPAGYPAHAQSASGYAPPSDLAPAPRPRRKVPTALIVIAAILLVGTIVGLNVAANLGAF